MDRPIFENDLGFRRTDRKAEQLRVAIDDSYYVIGGVH